MSFGSYIAQAANAEADRRWTSSENNRNRALNKYQIDANLDLGMRNLESSFTLGAANLITNKGLTERSQDIQLGLGNVRNRLSERGQDISKYGMDLQSQQFYDNLDANIQMDNRRFGLLQDQFNLQQDQFGLDVDRFELQQDQFGLLRDQFGLQQRRYDEIELPAYQQSSEIANYLWENKDKDLIDRNKQIIEEKDELYKDYLSTIESIEDVNYQRDKLKAARSNRSTNFIQDYWSGEKSFFESAGDSLYDAMRVNIQTPLYNFLGIYNEEEEIPYEDQTHPKMSEKLPETMALYEALNKLYPFPGMDADQTSNASYFNMASYPYYNNQQIIR